MAVRQGKFKAYDQRTGRLERAVDIIQDGDEPGLWVARAEADPPHPLRRKVIIPPDRTNYFPGRVKENTYEDAQFKYMFGYTAGPNLWQQRTTPVLSWGSGGALLDATEFVGGGEGAGTPIGLLLALTYAGT